MTNQSSRPPLPVALKKKRNRDIFARVILCVLLLALLIVVIVLWGEKVFPFPRSAPRRVAYAILMLIPFAVTGVPHRLIDRSFSGTVLAVNVKEGTGSYRMGSSIWPYTKHDLVLTVQRDIGKTIKYTALSVGIKNHPSSPVPNIAKIEYQTDNFSVGDRVHKYYGFRHLFVEPKTEVDRKYCIVCGTKNDNDQSFCWSCHSELISFDE